MISLPTLFFWTTACAQTAPVTIVPGSCDLVPVLLEEFDELSVSPNRIGPARWTAHTPWWGDFGDARFTDPGPDGPFSIEDGMLSITAWKDDKGEWRSGLLAAADRAGRGYGTQYGYFETRLKLPPGPGTWPVFWLMPLQPVGNVDPVIEIDVMEYYGKWPDSFSSTVHVHYDDETLTRNNGTSTSVPVGALTTDFHTFGVDLSPDWIILFHNGEEFWRHPKPEELDFPMYPLVNLALGSGWPIDETPNPSVMLVDYVHVYARSDSRDCEPGPARQP